MSVPIGSQVIVESEGGLAGTVVETRGNRLRCQLQDGRSVWVREEDVRPRHPRHAPRVDPRPAPRVDKPPEPASFVVTQAASPPEFAVSPPREHEPSWSWFFFSLQGRISRGRYWLGAFVVSLLTVIPITVVFVLWMQSFTSIESLMTLSDDPLEWDLDEEWASLFLLVFLMTLPAAWMQLALMTKRWHDRGKSGLWSLVYLVPYIGALWVLVELGCLPGTRGPNRYGPDPLQS